MKSHPTMPMRNTLYRNQVVEKSSGGSSYLTFAFNLWATADAETSLMMEDGKWELQIFELDGVSNKNWVRSLFDYTETVDSSSYDGTEEEITSESVNWNTDSDTYYAMRWGDDSMGFSSGVYPGIFDGSQEFGMSQAANHSAFASNLEVVVPNLDTNPTLGSGFPARRSGFTNNNGAYTFRITGSNPVWVALSIQ